MLDSESRVDHADTDDDGSSGRARPAEHGFGELLSWLRSRQVTPAGVTAPDGAAADTRDRCGLSPWAAGPEQVVQFFQIVAFRRLTVSDGDPVENVPGPQLGCVSVEPGGLRADLALQLDYEQRWFFREAQVGDLSAAVPMAPGETLSLTIRNTQRKQFDQEVVDEVEASQQSESTTADKEAVNVSRSSSKQRNWSVGGNAAVSLGGVFEIGAQGSLGETVTDVTSGTTSTTSESTSKSASNLRTLHKVHVRQTSETTFESTSARRVTNPYPDRSLRLDIYELVKQYDVELHLARLAPVLVLHVDRIHFDRDFVLTNRPFLTDELTDVALEAELQEILGVVSGLPLEEGEQRAQDIALLALRYLFTGPLSGGPTIFNLPDTWLNEPSSSFEYFDLPVGDLESGLDDAVANGQGPAYTALAMYYALYIELVEPTSDGRLAVDLATSLKQALAPLWFGEGASGVAAMLDAEDPTEVFRRLTGFLSIVTGLLEPLLQPAEAERAAYLEAQRAEFLIDRVVRHLRCHTHHYTERYLHHLFTRTRGRDVARFVAEAVTEHIDGGTPEILAAFDPDAAFLDRSRIVVPLRRPPTPAEVADLLQLFDGTDDGSPQLPLGLLGTQEIIVPADGLHIEPVAGRCVLDDVDVSPAVQPIHVAVTGDGDS